ncbi:Protein CBG25539 [Caenorhabditis briggsae]|uniref:Protein CBG25539 n=1 Tax=Caenorhabditis briggsae TaxID=6238 RepID=B6IIR1_CAEBR|nr:Protein CBG25539 [Caenorhabditis briggsae]CAR99791.1 Protein CBG25539 [Caenorhabditis briggsae]
MNRFMCRIKWKKHERREKHRGKQYGEIEK